MSIYRGAGGASDATDDSTVNAVAGYAASAASSATNAANSATNAATSASNAAGSVASVASSASAAATSASNAATSASTAASSVTSAATQASAATTQATNAANSATTASTAASTASGSATTATTQANAATTQAGIATTKAAESAVSAASTLAIYGNTTAMNTAVSNASTSATNSANSATTSTTKASEAAASAANAASSASAALTSANAANSSASSAQSSANTATSAASTAAATAASNVSNTLQAYANSASSSANNASLSAVAAASSAASAATSATTSAAIYGGLSAVNTAVATTTTNANTATTQAGIATTQATQAAASAASAAAIVTGVASNRPSIRPSLLLDFANTRTLDPRITFTRASTAAFYDNKTTAVAEQNLFLNSEQFDNAIWTKLNGTTVAANSTTSLDGNTTADTIVEASTTSIFGVRQPASLVAASAVLSVYAKPNGRDWIQLVNATGTGSAFFNVSTGAIGTTSGATATITSAPNGFYRCSIVFTSSSGANTIDIRLASADGTTTYAGNGTSGVFVWGAQVEQRSTATAYTPTTTAAITNYIPVLQTAASGAARFDCNPTTGESLGLLIEESRTNLLTYSSGFDNAAWNTTAATITTAADVAPDGTLTASKLVEDTTAASEHRIRSSNTTKTSNQVLTYSMHVKPSGRYFTLEMEYAGNGLVTSFDVVNNQYTDIAASAGWTRGQTVITPVGNGWYRCVISGTTDTNTTVTTRLELSNVYPAAASHPVYTGNGYSGILIWGAQLEAGSFATSYIPTVASQVTRAADSASMTGTNFSSWYNQSQGTIYADFVGAPLPISGGNPVWFAGSGGGPNVVDNDGGNNVRTSLSTVAYTDTGGTITTVGLPYKIAYRSQAGNYGSSVNGAAVQSSALATNPTSQTSVYFGSSSGASALNATIKRIAYYPVALTSTQLQGLTS